MEAKKKNYFVRFVKERWRAYRKYVIVMLFFVVLAWLETKVPLIADIHLYLLLVGAILFVLALCVLLLAKIIDAHWHLGPSVILRYREDKSYENYERLLKSIFVWGVYALSAIVAVWIFSKWWWTSLVGKEPVELVGIVCLGIMSSFLTSLILLSREG